MTIKIHVMHVFGIRRDKMPNVPVLHDPLTKLQWMHVTTSIQKYKSLYSKHYKIKAEALGTYDCM